MAERSKALRSGRSPLLWAWVRIPLLTYFFVYYFGALWKECCFESPRESLAKKSGVSVLTHFLAPYAPVSGMKDSRLGPMV